MYYNLSMKESTKFTITGKDISSLEINSNHTRFGVPELTTSADLVAGESQVENSVVNISVKFRGGFREAASARVITDADGDGLYISDFDITPSPRSISAPQYIIGAIYGIAVWADKEGIYGLIDHSKIKEEALINAGFPDSNFIIADKPSTMYFQADLEQIDYNPDNFTIVKQ